MATDELMTGMLIFDKIDSMTDISRDSVAGEQKLKRMPLNHEWVLYKDFFNDS